MRRTWKRAKPKIEKKFRVNDQIRNAAVFVIDENGEQIGETPTYKAVQMAEEAGLDLVEVNPKGDVPVCRIMDYGQFKYEQEKKATKQKAQQKKVEVKGIRLSVRISQHDFDMRVSQARKFFEKGNKLKLELVLKGRERAHPEKAVEVMKRFVAELEKAGSTTEKEQDLTRQGGRFIMILVDKSA
jgi:translation initiation factor IF-3